jgi:hypothetical protein
VLKENHPQTLADVRFSFADHETPRQKLAEGSRHGDREERRTLEVSSEVVAYLAEPAAGEAGWPGLGQVCRLLREVEYVSGQRAGECHRQWAYALTSLTPEEADPARLLSLWRGHWQIENGLHWVCDVTLGEDGAPIRSGAAPAVLAAVRNVVLSLIRQAGYTNIASAQRHYAMYPHEALALVCGP